MVAIPSNATICDFRETNKCDSCFVTISNILQVKYCCVGRPIIASTNKLSSLKMTKWHPHVAHMAKHMNMVGGPVWWVGRAPWPPKSGAVWSDNRSRMRKHLSLVSTVGPAYVHPKIVRSGITPSIRVIKKTLHQPKALPNNPNLLKIGWTSNSHFLSCFRRFRTSRCWHTVECSS